MVDGPPHDEEESSSGKKRDVPLDPASTTTTTATTTEDAAEILANVATAESKAPKRSRTDPKKWLAYNGIRHTRVGNDFQVALLPSPSPIAAQAPAPDSALTNHAAVDEEGGIAEDGAVAVDKEKEEVSTEAIMGTAVVKE